jgi:hypothetical protein
MSISVADETFKLVCESVLTGDFGAEDEEPASERPVSSLLAASKMDSNTNRAWRPTFRTFVTVSLLVGREGAATGADDEEERLVEAGIYAFSAERMCVGVTTGAGVFREFTSTAEACGIVDVTVVVNCTPKNFK